MTSAVELNDLRALLEEDRVWCAYALADLEPAQAPHTNWRVGREAVVLEYRGLRPPVLFAHGDPEEASGLLAQVLPGRYTFTLMGAHRSLLGERLRPEWETKMWRMVYRRAAAPERRAPSAVLLHERDLNAMQALFGDHPDRPDSFHPSQLAGGVFAGVWEAGRLVSAAGTHIVSELYSVAAIGNVFTHPECRKRGYGERAVSAVLGELLGRGCRTIVLNVGMDNEPAVALYRKLGFWPFCGYYEGVGNLTRPIGRGPIEKEPHD